MLLNLQKLASYIPQEKQLKLNTWLQAWSVPKQIFFTAPTMVALTLNNSAGVAVLAGLINVTLNTGITDYLHKKTLDWSEPNDLMPYLTVAEEELKMHVTRPAMYRTDAARVVSDTLIDYLKRYCPDYPYRPKQPGPAGNILISMSSTEVWSSIRAGNISFMTISNTALKKVIPEYLSTTEVQRLVTAAYAHAIYQKHENNNIEMFGVALMPAAKEKLLNYVNAAPESLLMAGATSVGTPWFQASKWKELWSLFNEGQDKNITVDDMYQSLHHDYAKIPIAENANDLFVVDETNTHDMVK